MPALQLLYGSILIKIKISKDLLNLLKWIIGLIKEFILLKCYQLHLIKPNTGQH